MGQAIFPPRLPTLKLTYFDIQGVAEKVRLALVLGKIPFEDVRVQMADWPALKASTPYGQLPMMSIDGAEPMAQSDAMLRYAGTLATQVRHPSILPPSLPPLTRINPHTHTHAHRSTAFPCTPPPSN